MGYTLVSFHAHPDDEVLLTGGTLARAAAEGHRVVVVTATAGDEGLVADELRKPQAGGGLGEVRLEELRRAAAELGCSEVQCLGYGDSGMDGTAGNGSAFSRVEPDEAARHLAALLRRVGADVLTVYDPAGGYGHPDHVQVHRVGISAARMAGTPVVLEATVDRRLMVRTLRFLEHLRLPRLLGLAPEEWDPRRFEAAFADPTRITHRVDVRRFWAQKRRAMAAHTSQTAGGETVRMLSVLARLPGPLFRAFLGREWFVERRGSDTGPGSPRGRLADDIFSSLRQR